MTRREQEAAMGRDQGKGRGLPAGGKPWPVSTQEWEAERGDARPLEGQKTPGGVAREWEGESSCLGALTTPEWKSCPRGMKPLEWPPK